MTINAADFSNSAFGWVCDSVLLNGIINNSIYTAIVIVIIVFIIFYIAYHGESVKKGGAHKCVKVFIYMLISIGGITAIHHYAHTNCIRDQFKTTNIDHVFSEIYDNPLHTPAPNHNPQPLVAAEREDSSPARHPAQEESIYNSNTATDDLLNKFR